MTEPTNEPDPGDAADDGPVGDAAPPPPPPPSTNGERPRIGIGPDGSVQETPSPEGSWFSRLPLGVKIIVPIVAAFLLIGWWGSRGETRADDLETGDCFAIPSADEFESVKDQDCDEPHEAEVLAIIQAPLGTAWPGAGSVDSVIASEDACFNQINTLLLNEDNIPLDAELGIIFTLEDEWNRGDRELTCYIASPTLLLTGPVLAGG